MKHLISLIMFWRRRPHNPVVHPPTKWLPNTNPYQLTPSTSGGKPWAIWASIEDHELTNLGSHGFKPVPKPNKLAIIWHAVKTKYATIGLRTAVRIDQRRTNILAGSSNEPDFARFGSWCDQRPNRADTINYSKEVIR